MSETGIFGAMRRIQRPVGYMLGGLGVGGLLGCKPLLENSGPVIPDHEIVVDCEKDPAARSAQDVLVAGMQTLKLVVTGPGYSQESRVQLLGIRSSINVSGPEGQEPKQSIWPDDIATGRPVVMALRPYGGFLTVQQLAEGATLGPASIPSSPGASAEREHWLRFTLSCQPPEEIPASAPPR